MNIVQLTSKLEGTMSTLECGVLDLVHSDICSPKYVEYVGGMNFFRAFLDAFSRKTCIYYSKMVGAFNVFPQFQAMAEK
jgi:hypothetical protein